MKIWIDAQLSPGLALWLTGRFEGGRGVFAQKVGAA